MAEGPGMSDKTVVVTGATGGIGLATATELARRGAFVIGVGRSPVRCEQAAEAVKAVCPERACHLPRRRSVLTRESRKPGAQYQGADGSRGPRGDRCVDQ